MTKDINSFVSDFRSRIEAMRTSMGLKDRPFAAVLGLNYQTYRNIMGRDKRRPANKGPSLETIGLLFDQLGTNQTLYLLTGKELSTEESDYEIETEIEFEPEEEQVQTEFMPNSEFFPLCREFVDFCEGHEDYSGWFKIEFTKSIPTFNEFVADKKNKSKGGKRRRKATAA